MADLPVPVAPRRTTSFSPASMRSASSAIAAGWSPDGVYWETTRKGASVRRISVWLLMLPGYPMAPSRTVESSMRQAGLAETKAAGPSAAGTKPARSTAFRSTGAGATIPSPRRRAPTPQ